MTATGKEVFTKLQFWRGVGLLFLTAMACDRGDCQVRAAFVDESSSSTLSFTVPVVTYGAGYIPINSTDGAVIPPEGYVRIVRGTKDYFRNMARTVPCITFIGHRYKPRLQIAGRYVVSQAIDTDAWLDWKVEGDKQRAVASHFLMIFEENQPELAMISLDRREILRKDLEKFLQHAVEFEIDLPGGGISQKVSVSGPGKQNAIGSSFPAGFAASRCLIVGASASKPHGSFVRLRLPSEVNTASCPGLPGEEVRSNANLYFESGHAPSDQGR